MKYLADITMMVIAHGRERTLDEFSKLLTSTGFTPPRVIRTTSSFCILESPACEWTVGLGRWTGDRIKSPTVRHRCDFRHRGLNLDELLTSDTVGAFSHLWEGCPVESSLIAPDGIEIGWEEAGEGRSLLLVHPGVADARAWGFVRQHLPDVLRVAAMDRRGRGRSGRADDVPHTLDVEADDVLAVAEALGGGVVVVAHSIAATITLQALRRQTGIIVGAVLYEPPLPGMPAGLESSDAMNSALQDGRYEDALEAFLRDLVKLSPDDLQAYQTSPLRSSQLALIWTMSREVSSLYALDPDINRYAPIEVPVQLLVGDRTALHHRQAVDALAHVLPKAQVTVLEGQGHGALVQAPKLVADAIVDFIDQLPSS